MNNYDKWEEVKRILKTRTAEVIYKTFIEPLQFYGEDDYYHVIFITWPEQPKMINYIDFQYQGIIEQVVKSMWGMDYIARIIPAKEYIQNELPFFGFDIRRPELNMDHSFDTFVTGESNRDAFSAVKTAVEFPGGSCNPLLIYGNYGLGKTHLLQAAALYITEHEPDSKVLYVSGGELADRIIIDTDRGAINSLLMKAQWYDVLIVDDIQYMLGMDAVQETFLDIIEVLYTKQKQIIIAGNYIAIESMGIDSKLKKRFAACVTAEIKSPDYLDAIDEDEPHQSQ